MTIFPFCSIQYSLSYAIILVVLLLFGTPKISGMEGLGPMMLKMLMSLHLSSGYAGSDLQFNQLETGIPDLRSAIDGTGQYPILLFGCVAEASGNGLVRNHAVSTDFHPYST